MTLPDLPTCQSKKLDIFFLKKSVYFKPKGLDFLFHNLQWNGANLDHSETFQEPLKHGKSDSFSINND